MHSQSPFYKGESMFKKESERDWVTGAFFLVRKEVIQDIGFFDENYFMYTEEVDFAFRAKKKGWKVWYLPKWSITHYGGASSTKEYAILSEYKGVKTFYRKNMPSWQYLPLRLLLKKGAFLRIFIMGILKGPEAAKTYAKAFVSA
jgi:GT2 family glycosyltransferase